MAAAQPSLFQLGELDRIYAEKIKFAQGMRAKNTRISYESDWKGFTAWCVCHDRQALPATVETVALYAADLLSGGLKVKTVTRRVCGVSHAQRAAGFLPVLGHPEVKAVLLGAQRMRGEQPVQKVALTVEQLRRILRKLDGESPYDVRARAVLLLGFASALRRSNLSWLHLRDISFTAEGLLIAVRREKNDQLAKGRLIGIPCGKKNLTCPVGALRAWLRIRGNEPGPLFTDLHHTTPELKGIGGFTIAEIVKRAVESIGLDPRRYGGHSLRAGFVTAAGENGIGPLMIAEHTGHKSIDSLRPYLRRTEVFRHNVAGKIGL